METPESNDTYPVYDDCVVYPGKHVDERFWLVAVCGTAISIVSIIENSFLFFMLVRRKNYRSSHCLYLALLAFFDVFIAGAYIPLMSVNILVDYLQSVILLRAWFFYMIPMITISHIAMTASSFLMVAASFERYCVTVQPQYTKFLNRNRVRIATSSVLLGVLCKFSTAFELNSVFREQCEGTLNEWDLTPSKISQDYVYNTYWKMLFKSVLTVLVPFFLLAFMNLRIVLAIQRSDFHYLSVQKLSEAKRKQRIRAATRTLVLVVFTYLLSNILNVFIYFWEYIDYDSLTIDYETFYLFAADVVSLLTVFAGALRLPIYVCCQSQLRKEFVTQLKKWFLGRNYKGYNQTTMTTRTGVDMVEKNIEDFELVEDESSGRDYANLLMRLGTALLEQKPQGTTMMAGGCEERKNENEEEEVEKEGRSTQSENSFEELV